MLRTIFALVTAPLWFAVTKTKRARSKRARKAVRSAPVKRTRTKASARRRPPAAAKKVAPARVESPAESEEVAASLPPLEAPIQAPGLFSPLPGEAAESLTPSFRWFYVGGARHYELVWSPDANFHRQHILLTNQTAASLPVEQTLEPDTVYAWRVRGGNEGGWGPWSTTRVFRTPPK
jgi:hypothetical protein